MSGWIKLHRQFLSWEWFNKSEAVHLFMYLLLKANHKDGTWQGIDIKKGQFITSYGKISSDTGISLQTIRTLLKKLENTNEINTQTTNKYTVITICKYADYQSEESDTNTQLTNNQQTTNNQLTTNNNDKKEKKDIEERKSNFAISLHPFVETYGREMMNEFFLYWTEPNQQKTKMKFELERTWSLDRRLTTWSKQSVKFGTAVSKAEKHKFNPYG
jgi:hypothetical protein